MIERNTYFLIIVLISNIRLHGQEYKAPDTVFVQSGHLILTALMWLPPGHGPFAKEKSEELVLISYRI